MTARHSRPIRIGQILLAASLVSLVTAPAWAGPGDPVPLSASAASMLTRTLGAAAAPAVSGGGRELFEAVLASPAFRSGSVGPFDVHVLAAGSGGAAWQEADRVRDAVVKTLAPAADLVARLWPAGGGGLISATRFPVVIAASTDDYLQLVSLLDHCERAGYSGWTPANTLNASDVRGTEVARTWEVEVFDLSHASIAKQRNNWLTHGVGYYSLAFVANRSLCKGAWGLVPPWLSNGLVDELDIAAYGKAWVGEEGWVTQTPGWSRTGWSGFVPQGTQPPAPVMGPPADLGTTVRKTGDPWLDRDASSSRHWSELLADLESEAPASFARAAQTESFLPRDRAAARCLLHLMLTVSGGNGSLTAQLDRPAGTPPSGMLDSDPLPVIFARALGGVPEVDRLEALDARTLLTQLGRQDLIQRLEEFKAGDLLALNDHRAQSAWLYAHTFDGTTRTAIFQTILEIEYLQQMAEWKALGPHLDSGLKAALLASKAYPVKERDVAAVTKAFRTGLAQSVDGKPAKAAPARARGRSGRN